ncbi:alkaline phosphatase [Halopseudomonas laoshanensis]|uniref:Alkaline phosphatase n=1 Tax=Halopseudomonas laoshanensis TaxID=2268758 RepID=A0A7V7GRU6_9GAMM|nr:choice-of-anchor I family protein [Halopseudomonas laoshanensis]KAA0693427.1 alkaline phosphatase [Halopseudomonas laoshanensis]
MKKWMMATSTVALIAALAGCNSGSNDDDDDGVAVPPPVTDPVTTPESIALSFQGRYSSNEFGVSAAEIPVYDPENQQIFVVNALNGSVDVLDARDLANPARTGSLTVEDIAAGAVVNSIAYHNGFLAIAIEAASKTDPGFAAIYDATTLQLIDSTQVGALPDMLTFTPGGEYLLVANEGEPSDDYSVDPEGSVSIIALDGGTMGDVRTADFTAYNTQADALRDAGVRIYGPGASVAQDMEPEYITVATDSSTAWVALQENNALAKINIADAQVTDILPLGFKDYGVAGNGIDASDEDSVLNISTWPGVVGIYHPDAIASYNLDGSTYIVTANEGDARAWGEDNDLYWAGDASQGFVEEFRVKHLVHANGFDRRAGDDLPPQLRELGAGALLNPDVFGYCGASAGEPGDCREDDALGRLNITWVDGYRKNSDGSPVMFDTTGTENPTGDRLMYDKLYSYGARSFAIWDENGALVWDSGDQFEQYLASADCFAGSNRDIPCVDYFNTGHDEGDAFDSRSDAKGPEPEGIALGQLGDKTFAFIGLERMGGIMVYDITDPQAPAFEDYFSTREDFELDPETNLAAVGDLGPEGLYFVPAADSPSGEALLVVGNEVSGTTVIYQIDQL